MDLRKLRYFCRVIEAGSMSRAGTSLSVAQPALSKSIQALEQELGTALLQRAANGVVATEAGERLYEHAQILFNQLDRARMDVRRSVARPSGHVVIGMPHSIISKLAMPLLKNAAHRFPDIRLEISQDHSHVLAPRIRSGRVDLAVMAAQRQGWEMASTPVLVEELFFVGPKGINLGAKRAEITFARASQLDYVLPSLANGLRASAESHFKARSLPLNVRFEIDAIGLIPECVAAGLGSTILPGGCISDAMRGQLTVRAFSEAGCHRTLVISQPLGAALTPAASTILMLVQETIRTLLDEGNWLGARPIQTPVQSKA